MSVVVVPRAEAIANVSREPYIRDELMRLAGPIESRMKALAPVSDKGSHGRPAGYLRSRIRRRAVLDFHGWRVDVISDATSPDGFPYGKVMDRRRPYVRPALPR